MTNNNRNLVLMFLTLPFMMVSCGESPVDSLRKRIFEFFLVDTLLQGILETFVYALPFILIGIFLFVVFVLINDVIVAKLKKIRFARPIIKALYFAPIIVYPCLIIAVGGPLMHFGMSLLAFGYYVVYFTKIDDADEKIYELKLKNRTNKLNGLLAFSSVIFLLNIFFSPEFLRNLLEQLL